MNHSLYFALLLLALGAPALRASDPLPTSQNASAIWSASGVQGGFWQYRSRTIVDITGLDTSGATDCAAAINAAIAAASPGTALRLPAGTLRLDGVVALNRDDLTLRGRGPGVTTFALYGSGGVTVGGSDAAVNWPDVPTTAPSAAGSGAFTVADGSVFASAAANNESLLLRVPPDYTLPVIGVGGDGPASQLRMVRVIATGRSGNTITFWPALPFPMPAGTRVFIHYGTGNVRQRSGLEDITVDCSASSNVFPVGLGNATDCWLYNVDSRTAKHYNLALGNAVRCSIVHCRGDGRQGSGSNGAALLIGRATACRIEDNILVRQFPSIEINSGSTLNVIAYNFMDRTRSSGTIGGSLNSNHGPHNSFNLYEGNIAPRFQSDGYFGSSSDETLLRNWFHGTDGTEIVATDQQFAVTLNRFNRNFSLIGNQIGRTSGVSITWQYSNAGPGYDTTCATSFNPALGTNPTVTIGTGLLYQSVGTFALFVSRSDPTRWVVAEIKDYNPATGTCYLYDIRRMGGTGAKADWDVFGGGGYTNSSSTGYIYCLGGPNIGNGGVNWQQGGLVAPRKGLWWPNWDGRAFNPRGNFNGATTYNTSGSSGDVVSYTANMPALYGGTPANAWLAVNAAKSGTATWATPGPSQTDWLPLGFSSFSELDYDVVTTTLRKGNWNAATGGIHSSETLAGGEVVPSSYYLTAAELSNDGKPVWWGSIKWPPFSPENPQQSFSAIPAGYRYQNPGQETPGYTTPLPQAAKRTPSLSPINSVVQ